MKFNREIAVGLVISLSLHVVMLFALSFIVFQGPLDKLQMVLDTVFDQERIHEEFTQEVEQSTAAAESLRDQASRLAQVCGRFNLGRA